MLPNPNKGKRWITQTQSIINKNFIIRYQFDGDKKKHLIGAGKYHALVGDELANKHFEKALNGGGQNLTIKLRRGLTVRFQAK